MSFVDSLQDLVLGPKKKPMTAEEMQSELSEAKHKLEVEKINTEILKQKAEQRKLQN